VDGEALRLRDGGGGLLRRHTDSRRIWLRQRLPCGTHLSRCPGHPDLRGGERHPAHGHRPCVDAVRRSDLAGTGGGNMYKHLLVPIDNSALMGELVKEAVEYAKALGARITFFHAQPDYTHEITGEAALMQTIAPEEFKQMQEGAAKEVLARAEKVA